MKTVYHKPKAFSWSFSKIKNYDTCPRKYNEVDVLKNFKEDSENLKWGNAVHAALAMRLLPGKVRLPEGMQQFEPWAVYVESALKPGAKLITEQQLAINEKFEPVEWFASDAWFRCVVDVLIIAGDRAVALDWKTGKIVEDSQQLALMAATIFAHYPSVRGIHTEFIWFKESAQSKEAFVRADLPKIWNNILPRVNQLKHAHDTKVFPPKPGFLCRAWCPVSTCEYHGEDNR